MATPKTSRPAPGARAPDPAANPETPVGATPDTPAAPAAPEKPAIDFEAPPALQPSEPAPDAEIVEVETTGDFMLVDPTNLKEISHEGSTAVEQTEFIKTALNDGRLKKAKK